MFRTSYVHHQEDYIVHGALYGMFSMRIKQAVYQVEYILPDDEHQMFETRRRQKELN